MYLRQSLIKNYERPREKFSAQPQVGGDDVTMHQVADVDRIAMLRLGNILGNRIGRWAGEVSQTRSFTCPLQLGDWFQPLGTAIDNRFAEHAPYDRHPHTALLGQETPHCRPDLRDLRGALLALGTCFHRYLPAFACSALPSGLKPKMWNWCDSGSKPCC